MAPVGESPLIYSTASTSALTKVQLAVEIPAGTSENVPVQLDNFHLQVGCDP